MTTRRRLSRCIFHQAASLATRPDLGSHRAAHPALNVLSARNAEEALSVTRMHRQSIALLLTDMILPGMAGSQLAAELKALQLAIKVIMTFGYMDRGEEFLKCFGSRAAFLPKPYTPDMLTRTVREALDSTIETPRLPN